MAKLYFRYGTVSSAKTLNLLAVAHNYRSQQKKVLLLKPQIDTRFGEEVIRSRAGLNAQVDYLIYDDSVFGKPGDDEDIEGQSHVLDLSILEDVICILVDEAQFLSESFVNQLHNISVNHGIPVICYGLRTDFRRRAFPGSARLMEIADTIEEIKTTCAFCERKAIFNLKFVNGCATLDGPSVELGAEEKYLPVCKNCYWNKISAELPDDEDYDDKTAESASLQEEAQDDSGEEPDFDSAAEDSEDQ